MNGQEMDGGKGMRTGRSWRLATRCDVKIPTQWSTFMASVFWRDEVRNGNSAPVLERPPIPEGGRIVLVVVPEGLTRQPSGGYLYCALTCQGVLQYDYSVGVQSQGGHRKDHDCDPFGGVLGAIRLGGPRGRSRSAGLSHPYDER